MRTIFFLLAFSSTIAYCFAEETAMPLESIINEAHGTAAQPDGTIPEAFPEAFLAEPHLLSDKVPEPEKPSKCSHKTCSCDQGKTEKTYVDDDGCESCRCVDMVQLFKPENKDIADPKNVASVTDPTLRAAEERWEAHGAVIVSANSKHLQIKRTLTDEEKSHFYSKWGRVGGGRPPAQASIEFCTTLGKCRQSGFDVRCFPKGCRSTFDKLGLDYMKAQTHAALRHVDITTTHTLKGYTEGMIDAPLCTFANAYSGYIPQQLCSESILKPSVNSDKAWARATHFSKKVKLDQHGRPIVRPLGKSLP